MTLAVVAASLLFAVAGYPLTAPVTYRRLLVVVAVVAAVALVGAVVLRWPRTVGWGLGVLTLNYGFSLIPRNGLDPAAPLFAAALVLLGEATLAIAEGRFEAPTARLHLRRDVRRASLLALGTAGAAAIVLAIAGLVDESQLGLQIVGLAAAGVCLGGVVVLVGRKLDAGA